MLLFCWHACLNYLMLHAVMKYFCCWLRVFILFACCSGFCFLFVVLLLEKNSRKNNSLNSPFTIFWGRVQRQTLKKGLQIHFVGTPRNQLALVES